MAIKYVCPICGRRFVDWGAEKLAFKCPTEKCNDATLRLLGASDDDAEEKPKLTRSKKKKAVAAPAVPDINIGELDETYVASEDSDDDEEEEEEEVEALVKPPVVVDDDADDKDGILLVDDDADADDDDTFADALDIEDDEIILDD